MGILLEPFEDLDLALPCATSTTKSLRRIQLLDLGDGADSEPLLPAADFLWPRSMRTTRTSTVRRTGIRDSITR
jgi:hypothetical protein